MPEKGPPTAAKCKDHLRLDGIIGGPGVFRPDAFGAERGRENKPKNPRVGGGLKRKDVLRGIPCKRKDDYSCRLVNLSEGGGAAFAGSSSRGGKHRKDLERQKKCGSRSARPRKRCFCSRHKGNFTTVFRRILTALMRGGWGDHCPERGTICCA